MGIYLICVIGLRTHGTDYYFYQLEYLNAPFIYYKNADFPGWNLLMNFLINREISFKTFLLIMAIMSVTLMLIAIYKLSLGIGRYITFTISLFLVYPFGHEAAQMRTFIVDAIVLIAVSFLLKLENSTKKYIINYLIYFILVLIASTFHSLAYYFIVVGIIYILLKPFKHDLKFILIGSIGLSVLISTGILSSVVISFLNTSKLDHWLSDSNISMGKLIPISITIAIWLILSVEVKELDLDCINLGINRQYLDNIQHYMNTILLLIPLLTYDITFNRFWRVYLILLYLMTGLFLYKKNSNYKKMIVGIAFFLLVILIYIYENEAFITSSIF